MDMKNSPAAMLKRYTSQYIENVCPYIRMVTMGVFCNSIETVDKPKGKSERRSSPDAYHRFVVTER